MRNVSALQKRVKFLSTMQFILFSGLIVAFLAIAASFLVPILTKKTKPICRDNGDCPVITDNDCQMFICENEICERVLSPGANCSSSDLCEDGFVCNSCQCTDPCENVTCASDACHEYTCSRPEGVCVLSNTTLNCCETDEDCLDVVQNACVLSFCNTTSSTCGLRFAKNGTCASSTACPFGQVCNPATCTCIDLCDGVMCDSNPCSQEICDQFSGSCVRTATIPGCCTNSIECTTADVCSDPVCIDNTCGTQLKNTSVCRSDDDCPGSFCVDCNCTAIPDPECTTNDDCTQPSDLCIGRICVSQQCYFFSTPSCCSVDGDCDDSDPCTENICRDLMCTFTQIDQDMDNVVCNVDCDDTNSSIGPSLKWCRDEDMDGFGNMQIVQFSCSQPAGFVLDCNDCDDSDPNIYPGSEHCDFSLSSTLFDPYDPITVPRFTQCGTDVDTFVNLTGIVCATGVFSPGSLRGGKLQMWVSDNGIWVETDSYVLTASGVNPNIHSVKIYEDIVVLGISNDLDPGTSLRSGTIKIFRYNFSSNTLTLLQTIGVGISAGATAGARFGWSVSIYNKTIIVGAPYYDGPSGTDTGAVFIFDETSTDVWTLTTQINELFAYQFSQYLGWSVSINDQYAIIGAPSTASNSLSYVVFYELVLGTWTFQWQYPSGGEALRTRTGYSVSVNQQNPVATSLSSSSGVQTEGSLFIFDFTGNLLQTFIRPYQSSRGVRDLYGTDVEIANSKIVVGAPDADGLVTRSGIVAVYFKTDVAAVEWAFSTRLWPFDIDTLANSLFGTSVSICANDIISVGAPAWETRGTGANQGAVYASECTREYTCIPI